MNLFENPEFIRNVRAQLRWGRMLSAAAICASLSLAIGFSMAYGYSKSAAPHEWGLKFLYLMLVFQIVTLLIGGGVACLQSIQREKDSNTFDFQRVTRLTPFELAVGKLFGAPVMTYFIVLCLMPAALVGAFVGRARPSFVAAAYVILILGSICAHAFALLLSLLVERTAATGAVLLFLAVVGFTSPPDYGFFDLGRLNAFFVLDLVEATSWELAKTPATLSRPSSIMTDFFFGKPLHHVVILVVLYLSFTAWYLLALARNIKRDPSIYELYSPAQALGLALYVNLIVIGFYRWRNFERLDSEAILAGMNMFLFALLGLAVLRNRERVRRLVRQAGESAENWLTASWPAPYILAGTLIVGAVVIGALQLRPDSRGDWSLSLAIFRWVFLVFWLTRDILYLQWMNLRQGRRQLVMAVVYLGVFYTCVNILFGTLDLYNSPRGIAFASVFVPAPSFALEPQSWMEDRTMWLLALAAQIAVSALFVNLQRRKLAELSGQSVPALAGTAQPASS
jgi:hypothetical protein